MGEEVDIMLTIYTMAEFAKIKNDIFPDFEYPTFSGTFSGKLCALSWATGAIIHSLWILENGKKVDCVLFKDTEYFGVLDMYLGDQAEILLEKAESGKIYIRGIAPKKRENKRKGSRNNG